MDPVDLRSLLREATDPGELTDPRERVRALVRRRRRRRRVAAWAAAGTATGAAVAGLALGPLGDALGDALGDPLGSERRTPALAPVTRAVTVDAGQPARRWETVAQLAGVMQAPGSAPPEIAYADGWVHLWLGGRRDGPGPAGGQQEYCVRLSAGGALETAERVEGSRRGAAGTAGAAGGVES
ncbi:MAG: hypothetical protein ACJ74O_12125 [Frankiaceae bacterium]